MSEMNCKRLDYEEKKLDIESLLAGCRSGDRLHSDSQSMFESAYDSFYKDIDRIYIIKTGVSMQGEVKTLIRSVVELLPDLNKMCPV